MTFKDLQKAIESQSDSSTAESNKILQKLRGKPFWYWKESYQLHKQKDRIHKGECCFTHIIGLPKKNGIELPLFDYEKMLYMALLVPGYLNSNPKLHTHEPGSVMYSPYRISYYKY